MATRSHKSQRHFGPIFNIFEPFFIFFFAFRLKLLAITYGQFEQVTVTVIKNGLNLKRRRPRFDFCTFGGIPKRYFLIFYSSSNIKNGLCTIDADSEGFVCQKKRIQDRAKCSHVKAFFFLLFKFRLRPN